ncbi:MAG: tRNA lysidine(34) synthetase TilS [Anaerolineales bacterium]|nr:tRNA lysidine(34) synthetase TilS [Anaerolineales bacterium]
MGVSGGPDSLTLMMLLHKLNWRMVIAHLNHQLRPSAEEEEEGVRRWAEQLGAMYVSQRVDIAAYARTYSLSTEDAARYYRYCFLFEQAEKAQAKAVLVAHTADDQVETVLMHLIRGAGKKGLTGMKVLSLPNEWSRTIPLVRPLLSVWRSQIMDFLAQEKIVPFIDESNFDDTYTRNRIRNRLIPDLETYNPSIRKLIWQTAQILAAEEDFMQTQEELAWQKTVSYLDPEMVGFDLEKFRNLHPAIRRRLILRAYRILYPGLESLDFSQVENIHNTLLAPHVERSRINRLVNCLRDYEIGYLIRKFALPPDSGYPQLQSKEPIPLPFTGRVSLKGKWVLRIEQVSEQPNLALQKQKIDRWEAWLDFEACEGGLVLRSPQEGDRFAPLSMGGKTIKLSDIFINRKVPIYVRRAYPLVCNERDILWVPAYTISHFAQLTPSCERAIHLRFEQVEIEDTDSHLIN